MPIAWLGHLFIYVPAYCMAWEIISERFRLLYGLEIYLMTIPSIAWPVFFINVPAYCMAWGTIS